MKIIFLIESLFFLSFKIKQLLKRRVVKRKEKQFRLNGLKKTKKKYTREKNGENKTINRWNLAKVKLKNVDVKMMKTKELKKNYEIFYIFVLKLIKNETKQMRNM